MEESDLLIIAADRSEFALHFWGPDCSGYTPSVEQAGIYTASEVQRCNLDPGDVVISRRDLLQFLLAGKKYTMLPKLRKFQKSAKPITA